MTKQLIIERTIQAINHLPESKAEEISAFVEFILKRYDEQQLIQGIRQLTTHSQAFEFLNDEEDLYTEEDLIEKYNG